MTYTPEGSYKEKIGGVRVEGGSFTLESGLITGGNVGVDLRAGSFSMIGGEIRADGPDVNAFTYFGPATTQNISITDGTLTGIGVYFLNRGTSSLNIGGLVKIDAVMLLHASSGSMNYGSVINVTEKFEKGTEIYVKKTMRAEFAYTL